MNLRSTQYASLGVLTSLFMAGMIPQFSYAQLEEITVTARRVEESLQDTPVAVTAFTGDYLDNEGALDIIDLGDRAPNVNFTSSSTVSGLSSAPSIFIRGIGQNDFVIVTDPAVGMYVDGVYLGRSIGGLMDLVDLERVEVLRGPQGTLYGRNSIGGAVSLVSKKPSMDGVSGKAAVTVGEDEHYEFKGSVNMPFGDKAAGRFSGMYRHRDGFVDAVQYDDLKLGDDNVWAVRGQLLFEPTDNLTIELSGDYSQERERPAPVAPIFISTYGEVVENGTQFIATNDNVIFNTGMVGPNVVPSGVSTNTALCGTGDGNNNIPVPSSPECAGPFYAQGPYVSHSVWYSFDGQNPVVPENQLDVYGWSANVTWDTDFGTFRSITAWREFKADFINDLDFTPFLNFENHNTQFDNKQFSQEFQFVGSFFEDKLDITTGLYYFEEQGIENVRLKRDAFTQFFLAMGGPLAAMVPATPVFFDNPRENDNSSEAGYFQAVLHATDRLHITGGIRYTVDKKDHVLALDWLAGTTFDDISVGSEKYKEWTPMISVGFDFSEDIFGYFTWSEGFRDGGFPARFFGASLPAPLPGFGPEFVTSYEVGLKSELFNQRVRANLSGFFTDYQDYQAGAAPGNLPPGTLGASVLNIGDVEIKGFELELTGLVTDNFTLSWNIGYLDSEIVCINNFDAAGLPTDCDASNTATSGGFNIGIDHQVPHQPKWNWSVAANYSMPIDGMMDGAILDWRANWTYTSEKESTLTNVRAARNPAWSRVDASVTLQPADTSWSLQLGARNLLDEDYETNRTTYGYGVFGVTARPRTVFGTFRYNFGDE